MAESTAIQQKAIPSDSRNPWKSDISQGSQGSQIGRAGLRSINESLSQTQVVGQHVGQVVGDRLLSDLLELWPSLSRSQKLKLLAIAKQKSNK